MVEFIKHLFGCCGEPHPSLLYFFGGLPIVVMLKWQIVKVWKIFTLIVKTCLKRFC